MDMSNGTTAVITSAAYVNSEIAAEFGQLPPAFLPMGHRRLFSWQLERLRKVAYRIVLSLPESYQVSNWDRAELMGANVTIVSVPDGLSLGESLAQTLVLANALDRVVILHGDTLFLDAIPTGTDWLAVAPAKGSYAWGAIDHTGALFPRQTSGSGRNVGRRESVATGLFALSSGLKFVRSLMSQRGDFLEALNHYARSAPLRSIHVEKWLDFGHLQTFYRSRAAVSTARSFNTLVVDGSAVCKSGSNQAKIAAEAAWFAALPAPLRHFCPAFLGEAASSEGAPGYRLGYEFNPTLHELFVCGALEPETWREILDGCFSFLADCRRFAPSEADPDMLDALVLHKTRERLGSLRDCAMLGLDREWKYANRSVPSPMRICEETAALIKRSCASIPAVMHGDFCFPNVFYDFRRAHVKIIDPRGSSRGGEPTIYGDQLYDLGKLNHSIEGYDLILASRFFLTGFDERDVTISLSQEGTPGWLRELSREYQVDGHRLGDSLNTAITIQLFLSMLPLHADRPDRQRAFLANALRLYAALDSGATER